MPQMAPYSWIYLMIFFNLLIYLINCYLHFNKCHHPKNLNPVKKYGVYLIKW